MSTFNAEEFLSTTSNEAIDTKIVPIPEGDHKAQITKIGVRSIDTAEGARSILDLTWEVLDENVKKATGMEKPTARQSIFLDLTEQGSLDFGKGKNRALGLVREALGQNKPGKSWAPRMLENQMATIKIAHRPDKNDPENIFSDVKKVTKVA